ncbi:MAG: adenylate/guanylate cyclase domain-containing protein, partial [Alphaproteobacteria bacterium]
VRVRMGINTGFCTVGNFGSDQRLDYTVLGSPVNLAFRLEAAAEANTILVSESTHALIHDAADATPADTVTPKGFVRPVQTYRLNRLTGGAAEAADPGVRHVGRHVSVSIPDRRRVREAIEELKSIQQDLEKHLGPES